MVGPAKLEDITNILGFNFRMTEMTAAIASEQLKKLRKLNASRLELVNFVRDAFAKYSFLQPLKGNSACDYCECSPQQNCLNTYYIFPMRFNKEEINLDREQFITILKHEGIPLSGGYTPPLYLQPLYIQKHLFKFGYPFAAKENLSLGQEYKQGLCPTAEKLYYEELVLSEHIRPPNKLSDMKDIFSALEKILN